MINVLRQKNRVGGLFKRVRKHETTVISVVRFYSPCNCMRLSSKCVSCCTICKVCHSTLGAETSTVFKLCRFVSKCKCCPLTAMSVNICSWYILAPMALILSLAKQSEIQVIENNCWLQLKSCMLVFTVVIIMCYLGHYIRQDKNIDLMTMMNLIQTENLPHIKSYHYARANQMIASGWQMFALHHAA